MKRLQGQEWREFSEMNKINKLYSLSYFCVSDKGHIMVVLSRSDSSMKIYHWLNDWEIEKFKTTLDYLLAIPFIVKDTYVRYIIPRKLFLYKDCIIYVKGN